MNLDKELENLKARKNEKNRYHEDYRTEYQKDYGMLLHNYGFRRLQSKTQTLGVGENDVYRTRLTHSLEVMQVGQGILWHLRHKHKNDKTIRDILPDEQLISTICLAHDIGHPPFGHGGEIALNAKMYNHGGFEGNGQTFRILTTHPMNFTRRVLLGVMKYPTFFEKSGKETKIDAKNLIKKENFIPKKSLFATETEYFNWAIECFDKNDQDKFQEIEEKDGKKKTKYKSLDCSMMDTADDIAYACHDLQDAIKLGFIRVETLGEFIENLALTPKQKDLLNFTRDKEKEDFTNPGNVDRFFALMIGYFIKNIRIEVTQPFKSAIMRHKVVLDADANSILEAMKGLTYEKVIQKREVQLLEFKGQKIILDLFDAFSADPQRLLRGCDVEAYKNAKNDTEKMRIICDYIAGMTDIYAQKTHEYLFNPTQGSALITL